MDTLGRTTLALTAMNVIDESRDEELIVSLNHSHLDIGPCRGLTGLPQVTYDYPISAGLRKPITIFVGVLAVFITAWVIGRLDVSIG